MKGSLLLAVVAQVSLHSFSSVADAFSTCINRKAAPSTSLEASSNDHEMRSTSVDVTRRSLLVNSFLSGGLGLTILAEDAHAKPDCFADCMKNCKAIAPKDPGYCVENCKGYCEQDDRTDGLSGSVSSATGEVGILGTNTVVKGDDKPPSVQLPGLDFTSDTGRKLIGY